MMNDPKKIAGTSNKEITSQLPSCKDLSDIVLLYAPRALYLKPVAKINISVNLPQLKTPGKTISTWEVMEKIRTLVLPDEFASLKVVKSTLEFIRLEGDLQDRCRLQRILARLDAQQLNLAGIPNILKIRVAEAKDDFPTRHSWDSYFRDAKHMNELKPGERPDTIHVSGLPVKWFSEDGSEKPSESLVAKVFGKWGVLRRIDVPAADPYRSRMRLGSNIQKFSYQDGLFFDAYIQYIEYMDFVRAMDALRGMKILKKDGQNSLTAAIKVDFDKTKHMSDSSVAHREFERKRIIAQEALAADKIRKKEEAEEKRREEQRKKEAEELTERTCRRQKREEARKRKALTIFRKQEEDKVSMKIAREEQKLIKAQRQLESIRLLDELFDRIKLKVESNEIKFDGQPTLDVKKDSKADNKISGTVTTINSDNDNSDKKTKKIKKKKLKKEKKKKKKRKRSAGSISVSSSDDSDGEENKRKIKSVLTKDVFPPSTAGATRPDSVLPYPALYPRLPQPWYYETALPMIYPPLGKGLPRGGARYPRGRARARGAWRGTGNVRTLSTFNPHLYNEQYYKYFANLVGQEYHSFDSDYDRSPKSRSRTLSRSRSRKRSASRLKTRSRSRSRSRHGKRSRSAGESRSRFGRRWRKSTSRSGSRSKSRSRSRSRTKSRSRSRSRSRTRTRSRSRSKSKARSTSKSEARSTSKSKARSRSKSKARSRSRSKSRSPSRVHSSRRRSRNRSNSKSISTGGSRNRYSGRRRRKARSTSRVKITRAKSRTKSPKRRPRSRCRSTSKPSHNQSSSSRTVNKDLKPSAEANNEKK